jgi:hypothetical protein
MYGKTGRCKTIGKREVKAINKMRNEEMVFPSICAAAKYFDANGPSILRVAMNIARSALSKKYNQKIIFQFC